MTSKAETRFGHLSIADTGRQNQRRTLASNFQLGNFLCLSRDLSKRSLFPMYMGVHRSQAQVFSSEPTPVRCATLHYVESMRHKDVAAVRQRP